MATPQYVDGASGMQIGALNAESGIKLESFTQRWNNERVLSFDETGTPDGFCTDWDQRTSVSVGGEVSGALTTLVPDWVSIATVANFDNDEFGIDLSASGVGLFVDDVEITQTRGQFKTVSINYTGFPDISE
jgi:hypothetical protein